MARLRFKRIRTRKWGLGGLPSDAILEGSEEEFMEEFKTAPEATEERVKQTKV
jgi:hypothetical protein